MTTKLLRSVVLAGVLGAIAGGISAPGAMAAPTVPTPAGAVVAASSWVNLRPPAVGRQDNQMVAVDCVGVRCTGVGVVGGSLDSGRPILLETSGTAGTAPTTRRLPGAPRQTQPWDISCPEPKWCAVVGSSHRNRPQESDRTWAVTGSGDNWQQSATPSPSNGPASQAYLASVSCVTRNACTAVGHFFDPSGDVQPLILRWNGQRWRWILQDQLAERFVDAVECVSARRCLLATHDADGVQFHWLRGGSLTTVPTSETRQPDVADIDCVSTRWCVAVGGYNTVSAALVIVTPSGWRLPAVRSNRNTGTFQAVDCTDRKVCSAATAWVTAGGFLHPGVWQWDGSSKRTVRMPGSGERIGQVEGLACGSGSCLAVGQSYRKGGEFLLAPAAYTTRR